MMTRISIDPSWPDQLETGLTAMALALPQGQRDALLGYLALLAKWNRAYNLTAVRDQALMVRRQLLDSLSILPWIDRGPVLDVGTGPGLPGIPLAIVRPDLVFTLLDSNGKKTRFVQQAVGELGLTNVEVIKARVERLDRPHHYACVISRAFSTLANMIEHTQHLLAGDGRWLAMKGGVPHGELDSLAASVPGISHETIVLDVPEERAQRHLIVLHSA